MSEQEARAALAAWGQGEVVRLVKDRENAVFELRLSHGRRAALRLHRPGYQQTAAIASELWWMAQLAEAGFRVPRPVPTEAGRMLHEGPGARAASVLEWLDGVPIGAGGTALEGTPEDIAALHAELGGLVAGLHSVTDSLALPRWFTRPRWDGPALLGDAPFWGPFWENPALTEDEVRLLQAARHSAERALAGLVERGADIGLIHADLLRENIMQRPDGSLALIDFDDCGTGFRLYDLATALVQSVGEPDLPARAEALLGGYSSRRDPGAGVDALPLFLMLRLFASCGWHVPRATGDRARLRRAAALAVAAARGWLEGEGWPAVAGDTARRKCRPD